MKLVLEEQAAGSSNSFWQFSILGTPFHTHTLHKYFQKLHYNNGILADTCHFI